MTSKHAMADRVMPTSKHEGKAHRRREERCGKPPCGAER